MATARALFVLLLVVVPLDSRRLEVQPAAVVPACSRLPYEGKAEAMPWADRAPLLDGEAKPDVAAPPGRPGRQVLWYRAPAHDWYQALPIGNGRLGAMVFGGVADELLQLNENTLWAGSPTDASNPNSLAALPEIRRLLFAGKNVEATELAGKSMMGRPMRIQSYQTLGEAYLECPGVAGASGYRRSLDLETGIASVSYRFGGRALRPGSVRLGAREHDCRALHGERAWRHHPQDDVQAREGRDRAGGFVGPARHPAGGPREPRQRRRSRVVVCGHSARASRRAVVSRTPAASWKLPVPRPSRC